MVSMYSMYINKLVCTPCTVTASILPVCNVVTVPAVRCRGESVAVCTIEKANVAINKLVQEGRLGRIPIIGAGITFAYMGEYEY